MLIDNGKTNNEPVVTSKRGRKRAKMVVEPIELVQEPVVEPVVELNEVQEEVITENVNKETNKEINEKP